MAKAKALSAYPEEYKKLFRMAAEREVEIEYDTLAAATSARNDLYTFRSLLYHTEGEEELAAIAQTIRFRVVGKTLFAKTIIPK